MKKLLISKAIIATGIIANASILIFLPQSKTVIAAEGGYGGYGGYGNYGDYSKPPNCILKTERNSIVIAEGGFGKITATCSPKANFYKWENSYLLTSQSSGIVYPFRPSTYRVVGKNNIGDGNSAKASIYVCGSNASRNKNSTHLKLTESYQAAETQEIFQTSKLFNGKNINSILYDCNNSDFNLIKTNIGWRLIANNEGIDDITDLNDVFKPNIINEFDASQNSGRVYRIYQAAFNREPDEGGLKYWISSMNIQGMSLQEVANGFINSYEFKSLYGIKPSNEQFVTKLYANVLHRLPDQNGYNYWLSLLNSNSISKTDTLIYFSESLENKVNVINKIMNTIDELD